jgi:hypothetical protein
MQIYVSQTVKKNSSTERVTGPPPKGLDNYILAHTLCKKGVLFEGGKKSDIFGKTGPTRCTICFQFITVNSLYMFPALTGGSQPT